MWWIMHSLHCLLRRDYLWQTSASYFLPEDRWEKFYTSSKTALGKHNYSWKHFCVTLLPEDQSFFCFFLIWAVLTPGLLGPELILRWNSWNFSDYAALARYLTKTVFGAKRAWWSNTSTCSVLSAELGYMSAGSYFILCLFVAFHHRFEFCVTLFLFTQK